MDRNKQFLAFLSCIGYFALTMINFALIYFLKERGFTSFEVGIAASIYPFSYFVFCLIVPLFIKGQEKRSITVSFLLVFAAILTLVLVDSKALSFIALIIYGASTSLLWPNVETLITLSDEGDNLNRSIMKFNVAWSIGSGVATATSGILSLTSYRLPFYLSLMLVLALSCASLFIKKGDVIERKEEERVEVPPTKAIVLSSWASLFLLYMLYGILFTVYPLYSSDVLNAGGNITGVLLMFFGIASSLSFYILGKMTIWQRKLKVIISAELMLIAVSIVIASCKILFIRMIAFALYGIIFSLLYDSSMFHGSVGVKDRSMRMVIHEVILTFATIVGSLLGSLVYQLKSFQTLIIGYVVISIILIFIEIVFFKQMKSGKNNSIRDGV